jgi:DNA mismatch endonuclease (patch repair protein)
MAAVHSRDTAPELVLRRLLHGLGYRYRLHGGDLPGRPDLVFPARHKVIFVHGCFWHRHAGCKYTTTPKTRRRFWIQKFASNTLRDAQNIRELGKWGWQSMIVWQCQLKRPQATLRRVVRFLEKT